MADDPNDFWAMQSNSGDSVLSQAFSQLGVDDDVSE